MQSQAAFQQQHQDILKTFISSEFTEQRRQYEKQQHLQEIDSLFNNYLQAVGVDPASDSNRFVATFYNKYPENLSKEQINFLKEHMPKHVTANKLSTQQIASQP